MLVVFYLTSLIVVLFIEAISMILVAATIAKLFQSPNLGEQEVTDVLKGQ